MRRLVSIALLALLAACGDSGRPEVAEPSAPTSVVRVFAASSLTEAFEELGVTFTEQHPGVRVDFTFAVSDLLVDEIERGKAAAVLATADSPTMQQAVDAGHARNAKTFARNHLALVVPRGNPKGINGIADLARQDVRFGLCEPILSCGSLAIEALDAAAVDRAAASLSESARVVLFDVRTGALDAGIVYASTAALVQDMEIAVELPELTTVYEISLLSGAIDRDGSVLFVDYVTGPEGQKVLAKLGFEPA